MHTTRQLDAWDERKYIANLQLVLHDYVHSNTGFSPFVLLMGDTDADYYKIPPDGSLAVPSTDFVQELQADLTSLRRQSAKLQQKHADNNMAVTPLEKFSTYQPGDLVLHDPKYKVARPFKLHPHLLGPYEVISQTKNDVLCLHLGNLQEVTLHMSRLGVFHGTKEEAEVLARLDHQQFLLRSINAYSGDPLKRTSMSFEVIFDDDTISWLPYNPDLAATIHFQQFIHADPYLFPLRYSAAEAKLQISQMKKSQITNLKPKDQFYINMRRWGEDEYLAFNLFDPFHVNYYVAATCLRWAGKSHRHIDVHCPLFNATFMWNAYEVYVNVVPLLLPDDILVDSAYVQEHNIQLFSEEEKG